MALFPSPFSISTRLRSAFFVAVVLGGYSLATAAVVQSAPAAGMSSNTIIVPPKEDTALVLDAVAKEYFAKPGEESCTFRFNVHNSSNHEVVINQVRTSCGCTVAKLPSQPWPLAAGDSGDVILTVDLRGKEGVFVKSATIDTATTYKTFLIKVTMPSEEQMAKAMGQDRGRNRQIAVADRQAVFRGDCAVCHAAPAAGRLAADLYVSACAICHDAAHRASMVPDLHTLNHPTDADFWRKTVMHGRQGTLMPAFAKTDGGPLTSDQIESLVAYLSGDFAKNKTVAPSAR